MSKSDKAYSKAIEVSRSLKSISGINIQPYELVTDSVHEIDISDCQMIIVRSADLPIRFTVDGSDPSHATGFLLHDNDAMGLLTNGIIALKLFVARRWDIDSVDVQITFVKE